MQSTRAAILDTILEKPGSSYRRIAARLGLSYSTVFWHLQKLRNAGLVTWEVGKNCTLRATCGRVIEKGRITGYTKGLEVYWI